MENFLDYIKSHKKLLLILAVILILLVVVCIFKNNNYNEQEVVSDNFVSQDEDNINVDNYDNKKNSNIITIDIKGEVLNPGVYNLPVGARVIDAIEASGGVTASADTLNLNLSKVLNDQNVIIINSKDSKDSKEVIKYIETECDCPNINDACINGEDILTNDTENNSSDKSSNSKISINTATKEELMKLKGIGESKAEDIIAYRNNNGLFKSVEDIKKVSGIGDKVFEKIKDQITT